MSLRTRMRGRTAVLDVELLDEPGVASAGAGSP